MKKNIVTIVLFFMSVSLAHASGLEELVKIQGSNSHEVITMPRAIVERSLTIKNLLDDVGEVPKEAIFFDNVDHALLEQYIMPLLTFLEEEYQGEEVDFQRVLERVQSKVPQNRMVDFLLAVNYLDIESFLKATTQVIAKDLNKYSLDKFQNIPFELGGMITMYIHNQVEKLKVFTIKHHDKVRSAVFSSDLDESKVVTASFDNTAQVWDVSTPKLLFTIKHDCDVVSVVFSPDGSKVVTRSDDNTVQVWDVSTSKLLFTIKHDCDVVSVVFSLDGGKVVTASSDHTAQVWRMPFFTGEAVEKWAKYIENFNLPQNSMTYETSSYLSPNIVDPIGKAMQKILKTPATLLSPEKIRKEKGLFSKDTVCSTKSLSKNNIDADELD